MDLRFEIWDLRSAASRGGDGLRRVAAATVEIGEELAEVLVALAVLDEEGDVEVGDRRLGIWDLRCEIRDLRYGIWEFDRGADEGADVVGLGGVVGAGGSVDAHVVGEGDGVVSEFGGPEDEVLGLAGTAEEGEGGSAVEFGEDGVGDLLLEAWKMEPPFFA